MDSDFEMRQDSGNSCESLGCASFHPDWGERGGDEETRGCRSDYAHLQEQHNLPGCSLTCAVAPPASGPWPFTPLSALSPSLSSLVPPLEPGLIADGPLGYTCRRISTALASTSRGPGCADGDPVSAAAHLHLLGESLSLIGRHLQETNKLLCASVSLSLLLDSLLCALAPLVSLTAQIPELRSCSRHNLDFTLENIAYLMPGL